MEEAFNNNYVVQVTHGHPGATIYTVMSTREHMATLVHALSDALSKPEESLRAPLQPADSPTTLWSHYATTAYVQTSRVSLVFTLVRDLAPFHVRPTLLRRMGGLLIMLVLAFAAIGLVATIRFFIP